MQNRLKALIVDDEDSLRKLMVLRFEQEGFSVISADNGKDGLMLAEQEKPHVVILDIIMPGMHGFEVIQKIRSNPELDKTVVVMTSAKSYKPDIDAARKLGADDYCIKPTDFDELLNVVRHHLQHRSGISA
ncbi:MAG TPA: response regulator [Bacteroidota bacterium]|nr:response regulator [Bacteroidota bacterium]